MPEMAGMAIRDQLWHSLAHMADEETLEVTIGPQGRLVIPASLRRRLGIEPGEVLIARAEEDRLVLERRNAILARLRSRFAEVPAGVSLADELIAERRRESARERDA
jgi:AbrB family looped-hinge helix DNA binding protein